MKIRGKFDMFKEQSEGQCGWGRESRTLLHDELGAKGTVCDVLSSVLKRSLNLLASTMESYWRLIFV